MIYLKTKSGVPKCEFEGRKASFKIFEKFGLKNNTRKRGFESWNRLNVMSFFVLFVLFSMIKSSVGLNGDLKPTEVRVKVKKCCQIGDFFNVSANECHQWPPSLSPTSTTSVMGQNGTLWFSKDKTQGTWSAHPFFWQYFSPKTQPILEFDSKLVGAPGCSTGREEDVQTVVAKVLAQNMMGMGDKGDENSNSNSNSSDPFAFQWEHNWENETNYFFQPDNGNGKGNVMLVEVSPGYPYRETYHNPEQFCVDLTETELVLRICVCSKAQPCIRKCCGSGRHLKLNWTDSESHYCVEDDPAQGNYTLPLHSKTGTPLSPKELQELQPRYIVLPEKPIDCDYRLITSGWSVTGSISNSFIIHQSGLPHFYNSNKKSWEMISGYTDLCMDKLDGNSSLGICPAEPEVLLVCLSGGSRSSQQQRVSVWPTMYRVALGIAIVVLLITAVVLSCLLEKRNIHSWTRLAYVISHFFFFLLLGLTHAKVVTPFLSMASCKAIAVLIHFTGLTTACWLSIINFDLWWTFKVLKPRSRDKLDVPRFLWYICFAFGLPLFIIVIGLIIQDQEPKQSCRPSASAYNLISPNYGEARKCSLGADARPAYWFGPLFVLLFANLIFFCTTTCRMVSLQRMTRRASVESTNGQTQSRKIFIKIFIVSGVTWWVEIVQWIFKDNSGAWYWLLIDMIHFAQAIALFVIFVLKRDVLRSLQIKYPVITKFIPPVSRPQPSLTQASLSTDPSSRVKVVNKLMGRKLSTTSTASSNNSNSAHLAAYRTRQESIELPTTTTTTTTTSASTTVRSPAPVKHQFSDLSDLDLDLDRKNSSSSTKHVQIQEPAGHYVQRRETEESDLSLDDGGSEVEVGERQDEFNGECSHVIQL